jgi:hypothetical protein
MKRSSAGLLATVMVMVAVSGCSQAVPGGPGVTSPSQKQPAYGGADRTFNLTVPHMSTTLHQGESKEVSIGIERGKNFEEDVTLKFADGPKGVTLASANPVIMHGSTEARASLKATNDASPGDFTVKMTGHPTTGADATNEFKITVVKK